MGEIARMLGEFLAPILKPIIQEALAEFFGDKAITAKPNDAIQHELLDAGVDGVRPENDVHSAGDRRP